MFVRENAIGLDLATNVKSVWTDIWMIKIGSASECRILLIGREYRVRNGVRSQIVLERDNMIGIVVSGRTNYGGD